MRLPESLPWNGQASEPRWQGGLGRVGWSPLGKRARLCLLTGHETLPHGAGLPPAYHQPWHSGSLLSSLGQGGMLGMNPGVVLSPLKGHTSLRARAGAHLEHIVSEDELIMGAGQQAV